MNQVSIVQMTDIASRDMLCFSNAITDVDRLPPTVEDNVAICLHQQAALTESRACNGLHQHNTRSCHSPCMTV